ncbi:MAG: hypothetical protein K6E94_04000 [Elusimicrobiaceae bacterium]|nr:hypothetical protein [Elusimicrobiaceae bacterium]
MRNFFVLFFCALFIGINPVFATEIKPLILTVKDYPLTKAEKSYIQKVNPYGFIFVEKDFKKKIDFPTLKHQLNKLLGYQVYFFVDQEGGSVNRLKYLFPNKKFPSAEYYGNMSEEYGIEMAKESVFKKAKEIAQLLMLLSIDVNLAPNAEIRPPNYTGFFTRRLYSQDPQTVADLSEAFAEGTKAGGVEPCYKHFPGTALSEEDPHKGVSIIAGLNLKDLTENQFVPFTSAKNYKYIMMGHALYPQIDAKNISTFSPKFYRILRNKLKFKGFIITDALNMQATGTDSIGDKIVASLTAGADLAMPFFDKDMPFDERLKEIDKIPPEIITKFNNKLDEFNTELVEINEL